MCRRAILNPRSRGYLGMPQDPGPPHGDHMVRLVIRPMMYLSLSYDHRIVDGQRAVTSLWRVKEALEDPTSL